MGYFQLPLILILDHLLHYGLTNNWIKYMVITLEHLEGISIQIQTKTVGGIKWFRTWEQVRMVYQQDIISLHGKIWDTVFRVQIRTLTTWS